VRRGVFLGVTYVPTARGRDPSGPPISGVPFYLCVHTLSQNYQISRCNTYGICFKGDSTPQTQGRRSQRSLLFLGFLSIYAYTLSRRTTKFDVVTHVCFRWSVTPQPKGADPSAPELLGFLSIYAYTLCRRTTEFDVITQLDLPGSPRSHPKTAGFQRSPIWGFLYIYASTLCRRTTEFDTLTHIGSALVLRCQQHLQPKGAVSQRCSIWGVPFYLCVHPLSQNYQI